MSPPPPVKLAGRSCQVAPLHNLAPFFYRNTCLEVGSPKLYQSSCPPPLKLAPGLYWSSWLGDRFEVYNIEIFGLKHTLLFVTE